MSPFPALVAAVVLALASGCSTSSSSSPDAAAATTESPRSSPSSPTTAAVLPDPAPRLGACYRLSYDAATSATTSVPATPCSQQHTAVTIFVGRIDPVADGHLLAVDSTEVQKQIADSCPRRIGAWVRGDRGRQRLSRFASVWFSPSLEQADLGARWYRCDLVAIRGQDRLATIKGTARNALASAAALDRLGTCGNAAPSAKDFRRAICALPHTWRAVGVVAIAENATYLAKQAQVSGDASCKIEAQQRATDPLVITWSFEWPTRPEWDAGQRYGLCWVPDKK